MRKRRMVLRARWLPSPQHHEADDSTTFELRHFDPKKRILVDIVNLGLDLMHSLFEVGDSKLAELEKARLSDKAKAETKRARSGSVSGSGSKTLRSLTETDL